MIKIPEWKKYSYFTHPITLLMVFFLLINQFFLSPYLPSFVSGKISDFALVYLLPLVFVVIGSLLPYTLLQKTISWLGFGMTIFLFGPGKILPPVNNFIFQQLSTVFPYNTHFVLDPTDTLALVMLIPAFLVWKHTDKYQISLSTKWKWVFLPAVMLVILADAAAPNYGITCLEYQSDGILLAQTAYYGEPYQSSDGGKTWVTADSGRQLSRSCEVNNEYRNGKKIFTSSTGLMVQFENSTMIRESQDGGTTWTSVYSIPELSQAENTFRMRKTPSIDIIPGPFDIIEDENNGNLIVAMGQTGVLVRTTDGKWQFADVDVYRTTALLKESGVAGYFSILWVEWVMCLLQVVFLTSLYNLIWRKNKWRIVKVTMAWLGWVLMMVMSPAISDSYLLGMIQIFGLPIAVIWAVICLVDDINSWNKPPIKIWKRLILPGLAAAVISAVIFMFWSTNLIKNYTLASGLVIGLTLIFAIIGTIWSGALRRQEEKHG